MLRDACRSILEEMDKGTHLDAVMIETTGRKAVGDMDWARKFHLKWVSG